MNFRLISLTIQIKLITLRLSTDEEVIYYTTVYHQYTKSEMI